MDRNVGHWLQRAARLHRAETAKAVADLGLFPGQEQTLLLLVRGDAKTVGDLAEALGVRPPTVSKTLQRLAAQKLVARGDHEDDARKSTISLTKEGARRAKELESRLEKVESALTDSLDGKEERRLRKLLKKVTKALAPGKSHGEDTDEEDSDDEA